MLSLFWSGALYSIYYVAHVEQGRTGIEIREAQPHGTQVITKSLLAEIAARIEAGIPVYVDNENPALRRDYIITPVRGDCRDYNMFTVAAR